MQFYGISFMHPYKQSGRLQDVQYEAHPANDQTAYMNEINTIKLHVQVLLRMNSWIFETCRRHYNLIKVLM